MREKKTEKKEKKKKKEIMSDQSISAKQ